MRKRQIFLSLIMAVVFVLQANILFAQSDDLKSDEWLDDKSSAAESEGSKDVTGSWAATVSPTGGFPFEALLTFSEGGGVVGSAQGDILLDPPPGVAPSATAVHGTWKRVGNRKYLYTVRQIFYGADGSFEGGNKVRNHITLNQKGDKLTGQMQFDLYDANGNIVFSGDGTLQATRIAAEPLTP